ncbi:tRNA 5-hydroxyuridine modification protein YegQ [Hydrogenophaga taeniospiralis]|uniref:prephenate-dependent tRNA uridine(34) hydroxylase TrhP n=1 Tax=Hydrogenophaga taeniospiralis TaxID=65656 RepID=UPI001CFA61EF|nr:tRNA 5-hydroxyuridine modification protein YegQ [Hydrogenophaga taeniospiralis]MCB4366444.1 tRNA 5-hydroxyuridine modification protein YegQ [Hydrogenophaga taeniospiralis]
MNLKAPELLLPAGTLQRMRAAYDFGADAVYAGQPRYSLRARNNEFRMEQIAQGIEEAHARGKKFFVTSNLIAHNDKLRTYIRDLAPVVALKPDALIMADAGLIMLVREEMERGRWPEVPIHLSVQANTTNSAAVKFWHRQGVARVILSRELSLDEVAAIRDTCPDVEIEVFVHGALCIAYSGRCLLSGYFNRRDPNQGTCTNACRWEYKTHGAHTDSDTGEAVPAERLGSDFNFAQEDEHAARQFAATCGGGARHPLADRVWLLEEKERSGELMPIMEDEHGTYIMNSKDLRAVEHVARLVRIGVDSLKIEGRTKSHYYVARTAQVYRRAIDDAVAGRPFNPDLLRELEGLSNRGYTGGLLERRPSQDYQNYQSGSSESQRSQFVGEVLRVREDGWAEVETKNRFAVGDRLEVIHPGGNRLVQLSAMRNQEGHAIEVAQGSPIRVWVPLGAPAEGALLARLL